jgi:hypothetical protein
LQSGRRDPCYEPFSTLQQSLWLPAADSQKDLTILCARRKSLRITYQALSFFAPGRMGLSDLPDFDLTHEMVKQKSGYDTHAEDA